MEHESPGRLRRAALAMYTDPDPRWHHVGVWLAEQAEAWDRSFEVTQRPSPGVDVPSAVNYGKPDWAIRNADWHARHALMVAREYLEATDR